MHILKPLPGTLPMPGHPLADAVGLWPINSLGNRIFDLSGNGNTGTIYGADWVPGKFGSALACVATNSDYIDLGSKPILNLVNNYSISFLIKSPDDWDVMAADYSIWDSGDHLLFGSNFHSLLKVDADTTNKLQYVTSSAGTKSIFSTKATWNANQQYHIVIVHDSANNVSFYIDGIWDSTSAFYSLNAANFAGYWLGRRNSAAGSSKYANITIEDFKIYNRCLAASKIAQLHREQFCMFPENIMPEFAISA